MFSLLRGAMGVSIDDNNHCTLFAPQYVDDYWPARRRLIDMMVEEAENLAGDQLL